MFLIRYLHGKPLFSARSIVKNVLRGCNQNVQETFDDNSQKKKKQSNKSKLYPDYNVIYSFPSIRLASLFNTSKFISTGVTAVSVIPFSGFYAAQIVSTEALLSSASALIMVCIFFHSMGFMLFNNLVAYIYVKQDERRAIVSYVNYWGKRVDLHIDIDDIVSLEESSGAITDAIYRRLDIIFPKKTLRLYLGKGVKMDEEELKDIVGSWQ